MEDVKGNHLQNPFPLFKNVVQNTEQHEQDQGTFSSVVSTLSGKPKRTSCSANCFTTPEPVQNNQSHVSITSIVSYMVHFFPQETPASFVHHKGCNLRIKFKPHHIRLLTVVIIGYTLTAGALLYYYLGNICDELNCSTTSARSIKNMNSVLKMGRDVSISGGKESYVFQRKPDLQEDTPFGKIKENKHSADLFQFHKDIVTGNGHVDKSKQMILKKPANPVVLVNNTSDNDTKPTRIRNREGMVVNENIFKGQVKRSVNVKCKGGSVTGSSTRLPRAALASSPGSGNTWTRHLLQQATGIATGSIYGDRELQRKGFPGETKCVKEDACLIVKTHAWQNSYQTYYDRAILLLRHPRESVVSSFHYFNGGVHLKEANPRLFHSDHWIRFAEERIQFWYELNYDWVTNYHNPLHIIFYEELKAYPIIQIEQAVQFLNFTMTETDKTCIKKNIEGNFQRKHKNVIDLDTLYNDSLSTLMNKRVQNLTAAIQNRYPGKRVVWA